MLNLVNPVKFFFLLLAVPAFSQQNASDSVFTEEIMVTANRIRMTPILSPNKVQVLNHEFISSLNGNKLSDALSYADAVFVKDYGFNSGLKTISLNSTQSEHALILLDGVKLNSCQNSLFDLGLLQLDEIKRIEISNGGSSSLYGADAIGGVINIISDRSSALKNGRDFCVNFNVFAGSYNLEKVFLGFSQEADSKFFQTHFSYSYESSDNNYGYLFHQGNQLIEKHRLHSQYNTFSLKISSSLKFNGNSSLELLTFYNYWNRNLPGIELGYTPSSAVQIDRDMLSSLTYRKAFKDKDELKTGIDYKYSMMSYYDPATFSLPNPIKSFYKVNTFINNSEYKKTLSNSIDFDAGYEISFSNILSNEIEYGKSLQTGVYSGLKIELAGRRSLIVHKVTFYPSLRYDRYSDIDENIITGKLGVNIKPFKHAGLAFKSSIGNNFRAPSFNDLFWLDLGNKNLQPEKSISFDAGLYYDFKLLSQNTIEVSYFNINTTDRIIWQPDNSGTWRPSNIGKVKSEGIVLGIRTNAKLFNNLAALLSINYNYGKSLKENEDFPGDKTYLNQLIYLPQEYFKSSLMLNYLTTSKFLKLVSLNVFYTFTGKRYSNPENTRFVPYYELVDANICLNMNFLKSDVLFKFAVNNLTNADYQVVSGYPMPLRNYKFEFGFKY